MDREYIATVDAEGHFDLPPEIRERHGITNGAKLKIEERGEEIVVSPRGDNGSRPKARSMRDLVGFLGKDPKSLNTLMEERRKDREKEDSEFGS